MISVEHYLPKKVSSSTKELKTRHFTLRPKSPQVQTASCGGWRPCWPCLSCLPLPQVLGWCQTVTARSRCPVLPATQPGAPFCSYLTVREFSSPGLGLPARASRSQQLFLDFFSKRKGVSQDIPPWDGVRSAGNG